MRLSLRFLFPLALVLAALAYAVIPLVDSLTLKWFVKDLEIRAELVDLLQRHDDRCFGMPDRIRGEFAHHQPHVFYEVQQPVVDQKRADEVSCPRNALDFTRKLGLV